MRYPKNHNTDITPTRGICVCALVLLASLSGTGEASGESNGIDRSMDSLPSITGVIRRYSANNPDITSDSWFSLSPTGLRVADLDTDSEIIKNFKTNRVWLVNKQQKTQFEVDVDEFANRFPHLVKYVTGSGTQSNILGTTPCVDLTKNLIGERVWRGQIVQEWNCTESSDVLFNKQLFNKSLGVVVRVLHPDSSVEELRDVLEQVVAGTVFQPRKDYRTVNFEEFMNEKKALANFNSE